MTSPSREAFEAWAKEHGRIFLERDGNGYKFPYTQEAWVGWQAAIQHARDVADRIRKERATISPPSDYLEGYNDGGQDCAAAIKEALK